ncbi:hypothetical protein NDU88_003846 [Pleurodeles waltl]|uniref:Uncharacterized protein n=1 Tax=Pleurodeles waltl TaxID=8319 RepID=A0AAV7SH31_PLEWA|nr:hypothetical protein NDU88_003846 [Pleurodeles waltl]
MMSNVQLEPPGMEKALLSVSYGPRATSTVTPAMCSWGGCAPSCPHAGQSRGAPAAAAQAARSQWAPGPVPRERGRAATGGSPACRECLPLVPPALFPRSYQGPRAPSVRKFAGPPGAGQPESAGGLRRGRDRTPAISFVCASRRPRPGAGDRQARPASNHQQGRGLPPAPGSPSPLEVRAGTAIVLPRLRPLTPVAATVPKCRTARPGTSRQQIGVGPSGAAQLSVRRAQPRGHTPENNGLRRSWEIYQFSTRLR